MYEYGFHHWQSMWKVFIWNVAKDENFRDDRYYILQSERNRAMQEKHILQERFQALLQENRALQGRSEDAVAEKEEALKRIRIMREELDDKRKGRADTAMRAEIDHLRTELYPRSPHPCFPIF